MANILLSGIPGSGKSEFLEESKRFIEEFSFKYYNLSDLVKESAKEHLNSSGKNVSSLDPHYQYLLRADALGRLTKLIKKEDLETNKLIMTSLSYYGFHHQIPELTFNTGHFVFLESECCHIDYFISLIDDPSLIVERRKEKNHIISVDDVLTWIASDIMFAKNHYRTINSSYLSNSPEQLIKHLVLPKQKSERSLALLFSNKYPSVCYLAGPIRSLELREDDSDKIKEEKAKAKEDMELFREELKKYCVVVSPIELSDKKLASDFTSSKEGAHTIYRDLHYFVPQSDLVIAHFPGKYSSSGTLKEMEHASSLGKKVILIHPENDCSSFGFKPSLHFHSTDEFFEAVFNSKDDLKYSFLRNLLSEDGKDPKFNYLFKN